MFNFLVTVLAILLLVATGCASAHHRTKGFWIENWGDYAKCLNSESMKPVAIYSRGILRERCKPIN